METNLYQVHKRAFGRFEIVMLFINALRQAQNALRLSGGYVETAKYD